MPPTPVRCRGGTRRTPWGVLVSEIMAQQTPVARVAPVWQEWMARWPTPADLAAESPGEVVRAWGRLGYPRRALRLREAAVAVTERHGGVVPTTRRRCGHCSGIGAYTAAAVVALALGRRTTVVDTNVRRVLARVVEGREHAAPALTAAESALAASLVPADDRRRPRGTSRSWSSGRFVCRAREPRCGECPVEDLCAWVAAGRPAHDGPPRRGQVARHRPAGARAVLQALRDAHGPVSRSVLDDAGDDPAQVDRCIASLVEDGLLEPVGSGRLGLPG